MAEQRVISFQCCFCHKGIEKKMVCAVVVVRHWETPEKAREQQFFCHKGCFEKATAEKIEV